MSTNTSIGPEAPRGGNEDHGNADGCGNKTLGEHSVPQQAPAGTAVRPDPWKVQDERAPSERKK